MKLNGKIKIVLSTIFFMAFLLGCEDDDDVGTPILTNENRTVAEAADRIPELSNLIAALGAADGNLLGVLGGAGPFTLFAPTDDAFAALAGSLGFENASELLGALNGAQLADILTYHVVPSTVLSGGLSNGQDLTTVQGESIIVSTDGGVFIQDKTELTATNTAAAVTKADDVTSNGVIHLIDKVLLPQSIIDGLSLDIRPTVFELAADNEDLSILQAALEKSGLTDVLNSKNVNDDGEELGYTVFAPTDDAFVALLDALGDDYNSLDDFDNAVETQLLTNILLYHVLPVRVQEADLAPGSQETALDDNSIDINASGATFTLGDASTMETNITATDIDGSNGVVHTVDRVLLPQEALDFVANLESPDLATVVSDTPALSSLLAALEATELTSLFVDDTNESFVQGEDEEDEDFEERRTPDNFTYFKTATVFAPTNAAFDDLLDLLGDDYNSLDDFDTEEEIDLLRDVLLYHVVSGTALSTDLEANTTLGTQLADNELEVLFSFENDVFLIGDATGADDANIAIPDVPARNGVAHVIDKVLLPMALVDLINSLNEEE